MTRPNGSKPAEPDPVRQPTMFAVLKFVRAHPACTVRVVASEMFKDRARGGIPLAQDCLKRLLDGGLVRREMSVTKSAAAHYTATRSKRPVKEEVLRINGVSVASTPPNWLKDAT